MARGRGGEEERQREGEAFDSYSNLLATGLELPVPATRHKPESNRRREGSTGAGEEQERNREEASGESEGGEGGKEQEKTSINAAGTTKISFRRRERGTKILSRLPVHTRRPL